MAYLKNKPLLLLDLDGVLLPFGCDEAPEGYEVLERPKFSVYVSGHNVIRLAMFEPYFDFVIASMWQSEFNKEIGPWHGLSELPWIDFNTPPWQGYPTEEFTMKYSELKVVKATFKLEDISNYVGDRPFAWIDDHIEDDGFEWVNNREIPTLFIKTQCDVGFTDDHVSQLLEFAKSLKKGKRVKI